MKRLVFTLMLLVLFSSSLNQLMAQERASMDQLRRLFTVIEQEKLSIPEVINILQGLEKDGEREVNLSREIILTVDYSQSLEEMINASNYEWISFDITEEKFHFPVEFLGKKVTVSAKLFHFNREVNSEVVLEELDSAGYRPAFVSELLALGNNYPELQKPSFIIALGSMWWSHNKEGDVEAYCPILSIDCQERQLYFQWFYAVRNPDSYFLAVRK